MKRSTLVKVPKYVTMFTLQYISSNICAKPFMAFTMLGILFTTSIGCYLELMVYLCGVVLMQADHFKMLTNDTNDTIEHVLVRSVIEKRPFKYADDSSLYAHIWQGIIADINLLVRAKYNNKYYHLGDIEVTKDRFFGIMNSFSRSLRTKKEPSIVSFSDWEKTLLIARNIYEEDSCNEKVCDEKY